MLVALLPLDLSRRSEKKIAVALRFLYVIGM